MVCQAGPCFCFHGLRYSAGGGVACASGRLAAAPRKRPEAVSGGRTLCAPTHLFLCGDVPCIPRAAPRPPFIRAPSVWCPFSRRGAQCAPAGSRRSHPAGADIIRPMFRRPAQLPPHNALFAAALGGPIPPGIFPPSTPEKRPPSAFLRRTEVFSCIWGKSPCNSLLHRLEWE